MSLASGQRAHQDIIGSTLHVSASLAASTTIMEYSAFHNKDRECRLQDVSLGTCFKDVRAFHRSLPGYAPTPLISWSHYAALHGLRSVSIKDESARFGLNAFKGLGASYALHMLGDKKSPVVSCTDGNHGRALAYFARAEGRPCYIFMPQGSEEWRVRSIEEFGAHVEVMQMNYDDTVRHASDFAKASGYALVQDQAFDGYTETPENIVLGYTTLIAEALEQMEAPPTHVLLQAGVGSFAGAVCWYLANMPFELPRIFIVESSECPCIMRSVEYGSFCAIGGAPKTIMAGLNCGEANVQTLPVIESCAEWLVACDDDVARRGMELAMHPEGADPSFSSGECGAVTLGLLDSILQDGRAHEFGFDANSSILLVNTEGRWTPDTI